MKPIYIYITPFFPSTESWRGAYCLDFVKALMRTGRYDVHVFMEGGGRDYEIQGVKVHRFPVRRLPSNMFPYLFTKRNVRSFLAKVAACGIDVKNVAVCHANTANFGVYPLAIKNANPNCLTLLHHHDLQSFGLNNGILCHCWPYNLIQFPRLRKMHEKIDCHVFISEQARRSFLAVPDTSWTQYGYYKKQMRGLGFYRSPKIKKSLVLHNGVDTSLFTPDTTVKAGRSFTVGCVGNFNSLKDQIGLLKALAIADKQLGDWRLKLLGSGDNESELRAFVASHGMVGKVEFLHEVQHEQLPDFYRSLDLFVLPSWFEGFGCVFTEAWACSVPFITCEGQGACDLIPEGERNIWLCRQRDPEDLASRIIHYFKERPQQHLSGPIATDELVSRFVADIDGLADIAG